MTVCSREDYKLQRVEGMLRKGQAEEKDSRTETYMVPNHEYRHSCRSAYLAEHGQTSPDHLRADLWSMVFDP